MEVPLAVVELQAVDALGDANVMLVENRRPLHGRAVQFLAGEAMAELRIHRVGAHLVLNGTTVTAGPVFHLETGIGNRGICRSEFICHLNVFLYQAHQADLIETGPSPHQEQVSAYKNSPLMATRQV